MDEKIKKWMPYILIGFGAAIIALLIAILLVVSNGNRTPDRVGPEGTNAASESTGGSEASGDPTDEATQSTEDEIHTHSYQETVKPPTCSEGGYTTYTCSCGDSYIGDENDLLGHTWDEGTVIKDATEDEDGEIGYTCSVCGTGKTQIIPSGNHEHSYGEVSVVLPTCSEGGYTAYTCSCGDSYTDSETAANGHFWQNATCTTPKTCSTCGTSEGKAEGHSYESAVTEPTETKQGYTTHTCSRCGDSYVDSYTDPITTSYEAGTFRFCTDGVAYLYGENEEVSTYTGWTTNQYTRTTVPWKSECSSIRYVIMEDGVSPQYTDYWFYACEQLRSVVIPAGITDIGSYAFFGCRKLNTVELPNSVTRIGESAFGGCGSLVSITIPVGVTKIEDYTFAACTNLIGVSLPEGLTDIGEGAFSDTGLVDLMLPASIATIGAYAYSNCGNLVDVALPEGVTTIGDRAFAGCYYLIGIRIPASVTEIGREAFGNCAALIDITYQGTVVQWARVSKGTDWAYGVCAAVIVCIDGEVSI